MMNEEIEEVEDLEEEDLDIEGEIDIDSPPWEMYGEADFDDICDVDESTEDTALLRTAAKTEIIVTPISPVSTLKSNIIMIHIYISFFYSG